MTRKISYIVRQDDPGDELPVRLQVFAEGDNLHPIYMSAGIDLDSALNVLERHFSGITREQLTEKIY